RPMRTTRESRTMPAERCGTCSTIIPRIGDAAFSSVSSLQREHTVPLNGQKCQITRCVGAGIDISTVEADFRLADRGMTVNDILPKMFIAAEELLANPKQVVLLLLRQRHSRANAGVDEKEITA